MQSTYCLAYFALRERSINDGVIMREQLHAVELQNIILIIDYYRKNNSKYRRASFQNHVPKILRTKAAFSFAG